MTDTCELCDMRGPLAEILAALDKLSHTECGEVNARINTAYDHLEYANNLIDGHSCDVPRRDGPDTVRESEL